MVVCHSPSLKIISIIPTKLFACLFQRPMVRLKPGQIVETELDGDWMKATVEKVDASLALMKFSRTHSEWIYRGSTRLEPLFSDLVSQILICLMDIVLRNCITQIGGFSGLKNCIIILITNRVNQKYRGN